MSNHRAALAVTATVLALASPGRAQDRPEHFGVGDGTMTIPARTFTGLPWPDNNGFANYAYPGAPGGLVTGRAPLKLPNGSEVTQLCVVGFDDSPHGEVILQLVGQEYPRIGTIASTPQRVLATANSGVVALPGMSTWCAPLSAPVVVKSFGDVDGNGVPGWTSYHVTGHLRWFTAGGVVPMIGSIRFGAAVVVWRRSVSAAPAVASFSDVPISHPQFRYVEAMVASGITGGCGAGRYCPDTLVTRGQFAVFFSVALGLHYPN